MNQLNNTKEYTVSELNYSIKKIIEGSFSYIKVKGEVSQITKHNSGHIYLTIKDDHESISCVCWRTKVHNLKKIPKEGDKVLIEGKITTYSPQSKYQITIDNLEQEGEGSLLKKLEELKKRLKEEGLFNSSHKRDIPFLPKKIGVLTSESGAVFKDIIHRVTDRFPVEIILFPVNVQGNDCVHQIKGMFETIKRNNFKLDLIIMARGGGSLEDLMPFNDEGLVRKIFECDIPIISAIGHETDVTLSDFVADLRAPTPTAAAEFAVPVKKDLKLKIDEIEWILDKSINSFIDIIHSRLENTFLKLIPLESKVEKNFQTLDLYETKLKNEFEKLLKQKKLNLASLLENFQMNSLENKMLFLKEKLTNISKGLNKGIFEKLILLNLKVEENRKLLNSLSYKNVLRRGYSVVKIDRKIIKHDNEISKNDRIEIEFFNSKTSVRKI